MFDYIAAWMISLADDVLLTSYVPVVIVSVVVALVYAWWAYILFTDSSDHRPETRYLILGISLMFFTHGFEQAVFWYARTFNKIPWLQTSYALLSIIKAGYILSGLMHIYGFTVSSGRNKWFWRFTFGLAVLTAIEFAYTADFTPPTLP